MQILPNLFNMATQGSNAMKNSQQGNILKHALIGIQNAQLGKSFGSYFSMAQGKTNSDETIFAAQSTSTLINAQNAVNSNVLALRKAQSGTENRTESEHLDANKNNKSLLKTGKQALQEFEENAYGLQKDSKEMSDEDMIFASQFMSPYSMPLANPQAAFAAQPARFTPNEVEKLIKSFEGEGIISKKVLQAIHETGKTLGGATSKQIMEAAQNALEGKTKPLSKQQDQKLLGFAQKLQSENADSQALFDLMKEASPDIALAQIFAQVAKKEPVTLTRDELKILSQQLRLSPETSNKLLDSIGNANEVTLNGNEFRQLFTVAQHEIENKIQKMTELQDMLEPKLLALEVDAKKREQFELSTQRHEDKRTSQTKTLIQDSVLKDALTPLVGKSNRGEFNQNMQTDNTKEFTETTTNIVNQPANTATSSNTSNETTAKDSLQALYVDKELKSRNLEEEEYDENGKKITKDKNNDPLKPKDFATSLKQSNDTAHNSEQDDKSQNQRQKEERAHEVQAQTVSRNTEVLTQTLISQANNINTNSQAIRADGSAQSVFAQLEASISSAIKKNVNQLEVQLNPVELGAMNVMLTSRAGEVTAIIQPERIETAQMIAQQVEALKAELEHQGIKIEKIEVQLKTSNNEEFAQSQNQQWNGEQGQAQYDEFSARTAELNRLRIIGRGLQDGETIDISSLSPEDLQMAQSLQDEDYNLNDAYSSRLNLVA